jgi:hypothetical protein
MWGYILLSATIIVIVATGALDNVGWIFYALAMRRMQRGPLYVPRHKPRHPILGPDPELAEAMRMLTASTGQLASAMLSGTGTMLSWPQILGYTDALGRNHFMAYTPAPVMVPEYIRPVGSVNMVTYHGPHPGPYGGGGGGSWPQAGLGQDPQQYPWIGDRP